MQHKWHIKTQRSLTNATSLRPVHRNTIVYPTSFPPRSLDNLWCIIHRVVVVANAVARCAWPFDHLCIQLRFEVAYKYSNALKSISLKHPVKVRVNRAHTAHLSRTALPNASPPKNNRQLVSLAWQTLSIRCVSFAEHFLIRIVIAWRFLGKKRHQIKSE